MTTDDPFRPENGGERVSIDEPTRKHASKTTRHSLPYPVRILFAFNGAIFILPNLALMSIVNDRAALPPEYLPAYGAVSFLPWSVKPLYAHLSTILVQRWNLIHRHALIAILLCTSGLSFVGTAFVPKGGVALCFIWGFVRGLSSSWPEFLLGLTLIDIARGLSLRGDIDPRGEEEEEEEEVQGGDVAPLASTQRSPMVTPTAFYEEIASVFQAQAATSRNIGSLVSGGFSFILFAWRHYWHLVDKVGKNNQDELSDGVVTMLLLCTAALPLIGSVVAMRYKVGTTLALNAVQGGERDTIQGGKEEACPGSVRRIGTAGRYDGVAGSEDEYEGYSTEEKSPNENSFLPLAFNVDEACSVDGDSAATSAMGNMQSERLEHRCYAAAIVLFQVLLIFAALKGPISSVTTHVAWLSVIIVTSASLAGTMIVASYYQQKSSSYRDEGRSLDETKVPAKRLALYLLLRHSLPGSGYLFYSYLFAIFESCPLFMQFLSILGSAGATFSTWFYGYCVAKKYNSGWGIIGVIVATTIISSLTSLLNIAIVRAGNADGGDERAGLDLRIIAAPIYFLTGVVAELNFMPSLVLATTNVDAASVREPTATRARTGNSSTTHGESSDDNEPPPLCDEGMQYASFVSCIDFGDQVGSWITVPIVASLGISRDNSFANLDRLIILCSTVYLVSLVYLCLIRPPRNKEATSIATSTPNDNGEFT